jgi:hypothetical protein
MSGFLAPRPAVPRATGRSRLTLTSNRFSRYAAVNFLNPETSISYLLPNREWYVGRFVGRDDFVG